jgi:hypothetical protein
MQETNPPHPSFLFRALVEQERKVKLEYLKVFDAERLKDSQVFESNSLPPLFLICRHSLSSK